MIILVFATITVTWFGWNLAKPKQGTPETPKSSSAPDAQPTMTNSDAVEVFQRAFWKRPTAKDQILHAERREWADGDRVERWQWFIAVDPSDELARYLHDQNPFSLGEPKGKAALPTGSRPDWFPDSADGLTVRQSPDGLMLFLIQPDDGRLFATSQGRGFAKSLAVSPSQPSVFQSAPTPGRLPSTSPPNPNKP